MIRPIVIHIAMAMSGLTQKCSRVQLSHTTLTGTRLLARQVQAACDRLLCCSTERSRLLHTICGPLCLRRQLQPLELLHRTASSVEQTACARRMPISATARDLLCTWQPARTSFFSVRTCIISQSPEGWCP